MPLLSVFFIRASLIYLTLGFTFGGLMLVNKGTGSFTLVWSLLGSHIELLFFGWIVQLMLGVAFWILPRFSQSPRRGKENLAWLSFLILNAGIWMDVLSPLFHELPWLPTIGQILQVSAAVLFAMHVWPRIKPSHQ